MYRIEFDREAAKALKGLPSTVKARIVGRIESLASEPRPVGCKLLAGTDDPLYRIRVGPYRIIYEVRDKALVILVLRISSRGDAYKHLA